MKKEDDDDDDEAEDKENKSEDSSSESNSAVSSDSDSDWNGPSNVIFETNWAALSWAKSPGSSATVPTLLSSHHQREPLHHLIHFTLTHFTLLRWWSVLTEGPCPYVQNLFHSLPSCDGHLTARAADIKPKTASHWFGDVMDAGFNLDSQVQWFMVRVLTLRVMNLPSSVSSVILEISWRQVAWVVNRLRGAKEHSMGDHFREGGVCAGYWKIALFRMFPLIFFLEHCRFVLYSQFMM